jgi:predicted Zn-dependent protease
VALATVYVAQEDFERALEELNQLVAHYPNDLESRARRCEVYLRLERRSEAQEDLNYLSRREVSHVGRLRLLMATMLTRKSKTPTEVT